MLQSTVSEIESIKKGEFLFTPRNEATFGGNSPSTEAIKSMVDKVKKGRNIDEVVSLYAGDVQSLKDDINRYIEEEMNTDTSLKDNVFLQYIGVRKSKGKNILFIKDDYRKAQPSEQFEAQEAYKDLGPDLISKLGIYQLFTNGVEQKINSLAEMMPMDMQEKYMKKLQESKNSILQEAKSNSIDTVLTRNLITSFSNQEFNTKNNFYYEDSGYIMLKNKFGEDKIINNQQFYNGDYFKKYGTELNNVSLEDIKKLNKC
jgi:hypothetical protein